MLPGNHRTLHAFKFIRLLSVAAGADAGVSVLSTPLRAALHGTKVLSSIFGGTLDRLGRKRLIVSGWILTLPFTPLCFRGKSRLGMDPLFDLWNLFWTGRRSGESSGSRPGETGTAGHGLRVVQFGLWSNGFSSIVADGRFVGLARRENSFSRQRDHWRHGSAAPGNHG